MPKNKRPKPLTDKGKRRLAGGHGNIKVDNLKKYKDKQARRARPIERPVVLEPEEKPRKRKKKKGR